ncbi:MAG: RHS repeat-associated core domain-containing protein [Treponemataceae bacterium]|nr:RHS repeat-associated core domain-containing protein [Treponemataceae bacterium]
MQEKTLSKQKTRTSNIHSMDFGSVSYDIFGSPYQKTGSFLADDSLDFGYLGKPYNADTELYDYGFRDYSPKIARFSTVDPIRDGRNWYSYVVNDPVNYVDLWGLCGSDGNSKYNPEDSVWYNYTGIGCPYLEPQKEERNVIVRLYNYDPTVNSNEIISSTGEVGHTWIGITYPNQNEINIGWGGFGSVNSSGTSTGFIVKGESANLKSKMTSSYTMLMTETEAKRIEEYFSTMEENKIGYNYGGSYLDKNATMCSESSVNALNYSGGLNEIEKQILNGAYPTWGESYPKQLPNGFENIGAMNINNTLPNPNAIENKIQELNKIGENE